MDIVGLDSLAMDVWMQVDALPKEDGFCIIPYAPALKRAKSKGIATVFNMQEGLDTMQGMGITGEMILDCLRDVDVFSPCRLGLYGLACSENLEECIKRFTCNSAQITMETKRGEGYARAAGG